MDPNTGKIYELTDEQMKELKEFERERVPDVTRKGRRLIPLSEQQHEALRPMSEFKRKGYMKNQPCICGSGKKFKRCCWGKYA